jgi:hypothetical protein
MIKGTGIGGRVPARVGHGPGEARAIGSQHRDLPGKGQSSPYIRRECYFHLHLHLHLHFLYGNVPYLFGLPHPYEARKDDLDIDGWEKESLAPAGLLKTWAIVLPLNSKSHPLPRLVIIRCWPTSRSLHRSQMPNARCQMPDAGCQMPDAGCQQNAQSLHSS